MNSPLQSSRQPLKGHITSLPTLYCMLYVLILIIWSATYKWQCMQQDSFIHLPPYVTILLPNQLGTWWVRPALFPRELRVQFCAELSFDCMLVRGDSWHLWASWLCEERGSGGVPECTLRTGWMFGQISGRVMWLYCLSSTFNPLRDGDLTIKGLWAKVTLTKCQQPTFAWCWLGLCIELHLIEPAEWCRWSSIGFECGAQEEDRCTKG